ncbi:hypothetical protein L6452_25909 [Arctium lappa]|uniref:Uncharacterized protein n=1 Tax=Arctium lappa TaxID=4217 RepID=A0ACB9AD22_ARCLA|nr:hypothetical protein L6452_25909 [Arctium lappa]
MESEAGVEEETVVEATSKRVYSHRTRLRYWKVKLEMSTVDRCTRERAERDYVDILDDADHDDVDDIDYEPEKKCAPEPATDLSDWQA